MKLYPQTLNKWTNENRKKSYLFSKNNINDVKIKDKKNRIESYINNNYDWTFQEYDNYITYGNKNRNELDDLNSNSYEYPLNYVAHELFNSYTNINKFYLIEY